MTASPSFRVFVSSTFRDFDHERDVMRRVETALRERLRPLGGSLTLVDLRWGVFTDGDEGVRELDILRVCLDEIERTRPLFVGLLGDRYGWVPDDDLMRSVAVQRGLSEDVAGRSVTELEITYGVFSDEATRARSIFFLREFVPEPPAELADPPGSPEAEALARLKARLAAEATRVESYRVDTRAERDALASFEELAIESLWSMIEPELASAVDPVDQIQASFRNEIGRGFVGADEALADLEAQLGRGAGTCTVLGGPPGSGKSAVLATLAARSQDRGVPTLFHSFRLGAAAGRSALLERLDRLAGLDPSDAPPHRRARAALAALHAQGRPVLLCLDALDAGADDADRSLAWLPDPLPGWIDVVATTGSWPASASRSARHRTVATLGVWQAAEVVRARFGEQGKEAPEDLVAEIVTKPGPTDRASASPLWTVLAADVIAGLDVVDFARLDGLPGDAEDRLRALVAETAASLPGDVEDLYRELIVRSRRSLDAELVDAVLRTVAVVRNGIPSRELIDVCSAVVGREVTDLDLARVRWTVRGQVAELGAAGEIDVLHGPLRRAIEEELGPEALDGWRSRVADALLDLRRDSAFADTESLALLVACGRIDDVASWWDGADAAARAAAPRIVAVALAAEPGSVPERIAGLVATAPTPDHAELAADTLRYLIGRSWSGPTLGAAVGALAEALAARAASEPTVEAWIELRSEAIRMRWVVGDFADGLAMWTEKARIDARLADLDPASARRAGNHAKSLAELAASQLEAGHPRRAQATGAEALEVAQRLPELDQDPGARLQRAKVLASVGATLQGCGATTDADRVTSEALAEMGRLAPMSEGLDGFLGAFVSTLVDGAMIAQDRADHARARPLMRRAVDLADDLVAAEPFDIDVLAQGAQVRQTASDLAHADGETEEAAAHLEVALARREAICRADPASLSALGALARVLEHVVQTERARGATHDARRAAERGLRLCRQLDQLAPDDQENDDVHRELLASMAGLEVEARDFEAARAYAARSLEIGRRWAERRPGDPVVLEGAARSARMAHTVAGRSGRYADSWARAAEALALRERIVELVPGSKSELRGLAGALSDQATAGIVWDRPDLATDPLVRSIRILDGLRELDPSDLEVLESWADVLGKMASAQIALGYPADADEHLASALRVYEHLCSLDPSNVGPLERLAYLRWRSGQVARQLGDGVRARSQMQSAADLYERLYALDPRDQLRSMAEAVRQDLGR